MACKDNSHKSAKHNQSGKWFTGAVTSGVLSVSRNGTKRLDISRISDTAEGKDKLKKIITDMQINHSE